MEALTWEEPRIIFDPGTLQQTIGNQIVVLPDNERFEGDELVNGFNLIQNTRKGATRGFNVSVIRSEDNGETWSKPIRFERMVNPGVSDPDDGRPGPHRRYHPRHRRGPEQRPALRRLAGQALRPERPARQHRALDLDRRRPHLVVRP